MRFEIEGEAFLREGDELELGDSIRRGDLVWFDRVESQRVVMRLVTGSASGTQYRVERGAEPDMWRLVAIVSQVP
jgi:hypothetical protein